MLSWIVSVHRDSTQKLTCLDNNDDELDTGPDKAELFKTSANPEDKSSREVCRNAQLQLCEGDTLEAIVRASVYAFTPIDSLIISY